MPVLDCVNAAVAEEDGNADEKAVLCLSGEFDCFEVHGFCCSKSGVAERFSKSAAEGKALSHLGLLRRGETSASLKEKNRNVKYVFFIKTINRTFVYYFAVHVVAFFPFLSRLMCAF